MGNSAERDVLINLKLVADPKNKSTANAVASQAESIVTAGDVAYKKLQGIAEKTHVQIIQIQAASAVIQVKTDELQIEERMRMLEDLSKRSIELQEKLTAGIKSESEKRGKAQEAADKKAVKESQETAKKLKKAQEAYVAGRQKAYESAVVVIKGLADIAEGAAKMGLVSEENFEKFAKNINMIEDGISVFKAMTDVIWKSREALVAMGTATLAQAEANGILNASKIAGGMTGTGSTSVSSTATNVINAGGGVLATKAASGATTVGSSVIVWKTAAAAGAKAFAGLAIVVGKVMAVAYALTEVLQAGGRAIEWATGMNWSWTESITGAGLSAREAGKQLDESNKKIEAAEKRKQKLLYERAKFEDREAKRAGFSSDMLKANDAVEDARLGGGVSDIDKERIAALRDVQRAEKAIAEEKKLQEERIASGHFKSNKNRVRVARDLEKAQERMLEAEKSRLKSIMDQKKLVNEQIKAEKEKIQVGKDAMKTEQQRIRETIGRMTIPDREIAKEISDKKSRGEQLNRRDIMELERLGIAGDHASNFYANLGAQSGADSISAGLNLNNKLKTVEESETNVAEFERTKLALTAREDQYRAATITQAEVFERATHTRVAEASEEQDILIDDLPGYRKPEEIGKAAQQAAADGSDAVEKATMEVVGALQDTFGSMKKSLEDIKKKVDENNLKKKAYKQ